MDESFASFTGERTAPVRFRRVSTLFFEVVHKSYRKRGMFLSRHGFFGSLPGEDKPLPSQMGGDARSRLLSEILEIMDRKLAWLIEQVGSQELPGRNLGLTLAPVDFAKEGIVFWTREEKMLSEGDLVEMEVIPFPESPWEVTCFGRVLRVREPDKEGLVRVVCRFEHGVPPRPGLPAAPVREVEEEKPFAELLALREQVLSRIAPPAPSPAAPVVTALSEPKASPADANNRRRFFRVNDRLPLGWKVIPQEEYDRIAHYFRQEGRFPAEREKVKLFRSLLLELDARLAGMESLSPRSWKAIIWMRRRLEVLFFRAHLPDDENLFFNLLAELLGLAQMLSREERIRPREAKILTILRVRFELIERRDRFVIRSNPESREEVRAGLQTVEREFHQVLNEFEARDAEFVLSLRQFAEGLDQVRLVDEEEPGEEDDPSTDLITQGVNLSGNGIAFATRKEGLGKGDVLELRMILAAEEENPERILFYGQVVMVKEPEADRRRSVACHTILVPRPVWEQYYRQIVRAQRKHLASRTETVEDIQE